GMPRESGVFEAFREYGSARTAVPLHHCCSVVRSAAATAGRGDGGAGRYLLMATGADVVWLPEVSVATTVIVCCPLASDPVSHHCVDWQVAAPPQDTWANWLPSPKYVSVARATLSPALAVTSMLLPVHAPFEGLVI